MRVIGLENSFMRIYDREGVREKLVWLLNRLSVLLCEDGRKATTVKVTVRDYFKDKFVKKFSKESRQCKVSPRLLVVEDGQFKPSIMQELVEVTLGLTSKMVDMGKQFHITLLGVAVTDFVEQAETKSSIKNFFSPKKSVASELGSVSSANIDPKSKASVSSEEATTEEADPLSPVFKRSSPRSAASTPRNLFSSPSVSSHSASSTAKVGSSILNMFNNNKRLVDPLENQNISETKKSKLSESIHSNDTVANAKNLKTLVCPNEYDPAVWEDLPSDIKEEIISNLKPPEPPKPTVSSPPLEDLECPPDIDPHVFRELPKNIRKELLLNHKVKVTPKSKARNSIKNYFSPK